SGWQQPRREAWSCDGTWASVLRALLGVSVLSAGRAHAGCRDFRSEKSAFHSDAPPVSNVAAACNDRRRQAHTGVTPSSPRANGSDVLPKPPLGADAISATPMAATGAVTLLITRRKSAHLVPAR